MLSEASSVALGDAAAHGDDAPARGRPRQPYKVGGLPKEVGVGLLADRAGHEDDYVRLIGSLYSHAAAIVQKAGDALRVVQVHLAAEGADEVSLAHKLTDACHYISPVAPSSGDFAVPTWGTSRCT